ncbi:hypothetical protein HZA87_00865 [Candidatus Uhrbacteria bacterium]|nr:hypothetical protein [Candidatus Uhrbacteria bacterium]
MDQLPRAAHKASCTDPWTSTTQSQLSWPNIQNHIPESLVLPTNRLIKLENILWLRIVAVWNSLDVSLACSLLAIEADVRAIYIHQIKKPL